MNTIKGLLIDIDDTLVRFKKDTLTQSTASLMGVLCNAGIQLAGLSPEEVKARMDWVKKNVQWWCWSDFIKKLGLDQKEFWEFAYATESKYLEPTEPELAQCFLKLKSMGLDLFITSNNPNMGIRHKLRLAGIMPDMVDDIFTKLLGATEMQGMKWEPHYWQKVATETGYERSELAVIGDSVNDDFTTPNSIGIPTTFLIDPWGENRDAKIDNLIPVKGISEIVGIFEQQLATVG